MSKKMKIITAAFAAVCVTGVMATGGVSDEETAALQAVVLRANTMTLFARSTIPDRDLTSYVVAAGALAPVWADSDKWMKAMGKVRVDDGRLMTDNGVELRVFGQGGEVHVRFIGAGKDICKDIPFTVCG